MSGPQQGFMNEMESTDHVSGHFEDEHERSAYIQELRNRFRPPSSPTGRVALYIQTMVGIVLSLRAYCYCHFS